MLDAKINRLILNIVEISTLKLLFFLFSFVCFCFISICMYYRRPEFRLSAIC